MSHTKPHKKGFSRKMKIFPVKPLLYMNSGVRLTEDELNLSFFSR